MLEHYLRPFLELCFPHVAEEIDWSRGVDSCETELQALDRDALLKKQYVDKLIKVWLKDGTEQRVYIHVEVQSDRDEGFPLRLYQYHHRLVDRYGAPVATLVVLADDERNWRPEAYIEEFLKCRVCFEFPVCKLLDLEQREDRPLETDNPVAILIASHLATKRTKGDMERRLELKWELMHRVLDHGYEETMVSDILRLVDWFIALPKNKNLELRRRIWETKNDNMTPYITSFERLAIEEGLEKGLEQGLEKGREQGLEQGLEKGIEQGLEKGRVAFCEAIVDILELRFDGVSADLRQRVIAITDFEHLKELHRQAVICQRLEDFESFADNK